MRKLDRLCHLANADNVPSILEHGLLSTERLLGLTGKAKTERVAAPRRQRRESLCLAEGVTIPDQRPMPPSDLACALDDSLEPGDRYTLLNSYVFLWPNLKPTDRRRRASSYRPQVSLTLDAVALSNTSARMPSSRPSIAKRTTQAGTARPRHIGALRDVASSRLADTAVLASRDLVWMRVAR